MKALKALILLTAVLGVIAAGAASMWLGRGVKAAVERYGPGIVGAPVTVGAVGLAPWSGRGTITNLVVGNPPGFDGAHALSVGSVEIKLKLSSLLSDTIVLERVVVREPEILYELGAGGSNLARLQRNAEGAKGKDAASPGSSGGGKPLFIKELLVTGGQVGLQGVKLPLPGVQISDLGGKGRSPAQAVSEALAAIAGSAGKAASGLGGKALGDAASSVMGALDGLLKGKR